MNFYYPSAYDFYSLVEAMTASIPQGVGLVGLIVALVMLILFSVPVITRIMLPVPKETRLADHLPFSKIMPDGATILCKNGTLCQIVELKGKEVSFMGNDEREEIFQKRKRWFDALAELGVRVRVFTVRTPKTYTLPQNYENLVLRQIAKRWNVIFKDSFSNRHIIMISGLKAQKNKKDEKDVIKRLNDAVSATKSMLHDFKPQVLNQITATDGSDSPLAFLAQLVSPISKPVPLGHYGNISEMITADVVEFNASEEGLIHFQRGDEHKYLGVIGIKQFGDFSDEDFVAALGSINGEITIMHIVEPWSKVKTAALLAQQGRMAMATRLSPTAKFQFDEAMEMIEGIDEKRQTMAIYQMLVYAIGDTPEAVAKIDNEVRRVCVNYGVNPVREGIAAQASWFAQFPSYTTWPRPFKFFSGNIATLISFDHAPDGIENSDWGEGPIAMFKTNAGTPYQFQFHISDERDAVAHGMVIGPTGGGKTTLISFLTGMAMRHNNLRAYLFDRYLGAYVFASAAGGAYMNVDGSGEDGGGGAACALNPFQCTDTKENRGFLRSWLEGISGCNDSDSLEEIGRAVKLNFESGLDKSQRSLRTLHEVAFAPDRPLAKALRRWVDPQLYGPIFNAPQDTLDTGQNHIIAFDFTRIYASEDLTQAMLSYLMHRIQATISETGAPGLIFVDETEPMLKHPTFRDWFLKMLQEYRKRGVGVWCAFQRPEALKATGVSELIRGQAQTMFFLRNPQAQEKDYSDFSLNEIEWNYIKGKAAQHVKRSVLIKRANGESVILDTDLSVLGEHLRIFNSGRDSVKLAETLMKKFGAEGWVEHYLEA
ncbi:MAG: hypothetical protein ACTSXQ_00880 [Alphaproteobacteria bacterium]